MAVPSTSAQHGIAYIPEVTFGVSPSVTPAYQYFPITGTTLGVTKGKIVSGVIRPDRQINDVRPGNRQVGGNIGCEFAYGLFDVFLEALFGGTWTSNVLKPGVVRRSFSVLRNFSDLGSGAKPWHLFSGVEFDNLTLAIEPEKIVSAAFTVLGRDQTLATTAPSGSTFTAAGATKAFDSFTGSVTVGGVAVAVVTKLDITLQNGLSPRFVVFDAREIGSKIGKTAVTGSMSLYFLDATFLEAFLNATLLAIEFTLTDQLGNAYTFLMPSCLGTGGQPDVSGDNDIIINFPFSTIYQDGAGTPDVLKLTRTPHA